MHNAFLATIQNISRGGVQIKTKAPLPVGEVLKLAFSLERDIARFDGTIVYAQSLSNGDLLAGLEFDGYSYRDARLLNRFLDSRRKSLTNIIGRYNRNCSR
jgi:hypothetical protein